MRTPTTPLTLPAEVGGRRMLTLRVSREGLCRTCGEEILRVSAEDWIHRSRVRGKAVGHAARPSNGARKPVDTRVIQGEG